MNAVQMIVIVVFSAFTGWTISWLTTRLIFSSYLVKKIKAAANGFFQQQSHLSNLIDDKISDPLLFIKIKPEIEKHVDVFLNEKLAAVFPLLYKFMGEKTLSQFKAAFMTEIDVLFPVIIGNYMSVLKNEINFETLLSKYMDQVTVQTFQPYFYQKVKKEILYFRFICSLAGFCTGVMAIIVARLIH